jgi:hypothetical protein
MHVELDRNPKIISRMEKWNLMINAYIETEDPFESCAVKKKKKFNGRLFKGPPVQYRWHSWLARFNLSNRINVDNYNSVPLCDDHTNYVIRKDLERTFPDEPLFDLEKFGRIG